MTRRVLHASPRSIAMAVLLGSTLLAAGGPHAQPVPPMQLDRHAMEDTGDWSSFGSGFRGTNSAQAVADATWAGLQQGGPWSLPDRSGLLPHQAQALSLALEGRWTEALSVVKSQAVAPDGIDAQGRSLLTLASRQGDLSAVRALIAQGADVDRAGLQGRTPLGLAALHGHELVVRELLFAGADVKRVDRQGQGALHLAARGGNLRIMSLLLKAGADPLWPDRSGQPPLFHAAAMGRIDAMAALVGAGVPVNQVDRHGLNAVHAAALSEQVQAVQWLGQQGVPVSGPLTQILVDTMGQRSSLAR